MVRSKQTQIRQTQKTRAKNRDGLIAGTVSESQGIRSGGSQNRRNSSQDMSRFSYHQSEYALGNQSNDILGGSNSLEQLLDDIVTDRCFLHRIRIIQDLGNLIERIRMTMKYSSKHNFIPEERATKIIRDITQFGWLSGPSAQVRNNKLRKQNCTNIPNGQGGSKMVTRFLNNPTKSKVQKIPATILQNAGYGGSEKDKGLHILNECNRALGELNSGKSKSFRIVVPHKDMTLPLRTAYKYPVSRQPNYRENRTSRLRTEYLSRYSLSHPGVSSSSSKPVSGTYVQCELCSECDTEVQCSISEDISTCFNEDRCNVSGSSDEFDSDHNGNQVNLSQVQDEKNIEDEDAESTTSFENDYIQPACPLLRQSSMFSIDDVDEPYDEIIKFKHHAEVEEVHLDDCYLFKNATSSTASKVDAGKLSSVAASRSPSTTLTSDVSKLEPKSKPSTTPHGSQGDIYLKESSEFSMKDLSTKAQSYPSSPSASFLNVLNCHLHEVECFHFQRRQRPPMSFDSYGNTNENFRMLLGLVGFPEIVRRKYLSKKSSPIVQAIITRNKPPDQLHPEYSVLDSTVNSEESFADLKCNNYSMEPEQFFNCLPRIYDPDCFALNANYMNRGQVSVSQELIADKEAVETVTTMSVQESTSVYSGVNVNGKTQTPKETSEPVSTTVLDTIHVVADKLVDDIWGTMMGEFAGLIFSTEK